MARKKRLTKKERQEVESALEIADTCLQDATDAINLLLSKVDKTNAKEIGTLKGRVTRLVKKTKQCAAREIEKVKPYFPVVREKLEAAIDSSIGEMWHVLTTLASRNGMEVDRSFDSPRLLLSATAQPSKGPRYGECVDTLPTEVQYIDCRGTVLFRGGGIPPTWIKNSDGTFTDPNWKGCGECFVVPPSKEPMPYPLSKYGGCCLRWDWYDPEHDECIPQPGFKVYSTWDPDCSGGGGGEVPGPMPSPTPSPTGPTGPTGVGPPVIFPPGTVPPSQPPVILPGPPGGSPTGSGPSNWQPCPPPVINLTCPECKCNFQAPAPTGGGGGGVIGGTGLNFVFPTGGIGDTELLFDQRAVELLKWYEEQTGVPYRQIADGKLTEGGEGYSAADQSIYKAFPDSFSGEL